jgi:two-component system NarL family response regulator
MNGPTKIRLLIADDHPVVRRGLTAMLEDQEDMAVVAEASDGPEALAAYREHVPDVALIDFRLPGLSGAEVVAAVRAEFPGAQIIIITTYDTDEDLYQAVRAGARGYLLKDTSLDEFTDCIRRVSCGETRVPEALVARLAGRFGVAELTRRELDVLNRMAAGRANREIAADLFVSESTVKTHINHIMAKLGCADRTQAVTQALRRGLIRLP